LACPQRFSRPRTARRAEGADPKYDPSQAGGSAALTTSDQARMAWCRVVPIRRSASSAPTTPSRASDQWRGGAERAAAALLTGGAGDPRRCREMRMVVLGERPRVLEEFIASRQALEQDVFDEVWDGEYHVVPGRCLARGPNTAGLITS
jgi:hypothetical protein